MLAYFDTNVFDNLIKKSNGVTDADEQQLRLAVASGRLIIVVSHTNIRETLAALHSRPEIVGPQLSLIARLVNWDYLVRFHSAILENDIRHFVYNGERANTVFENNRTTVRVRYLVDHVIDGSLGPKELSAAVREDWEQKREFLDGVKRSRAAIYSEIEVLRSRNEIPSFEQFFEDAAEEHVLAFVQSLDGSVAEECKRRGPDKLLKIPSVRAFIGLAISLIYRVSVDGRVPKSSASRDIQHAVCAAAAADVFVTHDQELSFLLGRVPINHFELMNLHELLKAIHRTNTSRNG